MKKNPVNKLSVHSFLLIKKVEAFKGYLSLDTKGRVNTRLNNMEK